jgi:Uma2 family endonuclease
MTAVANQFKGLVALSFPGKGMTDDEFFEFCQINQNFKIERNSKGQIIIMPLTGSETGSWNAALTAVLFNWAFQTKLGKAFDSSTGFKLPNGATYGPDAAWVSYEKWNALTPTERRKFAPVVPEFMMELRSPSDRLQPIKNKIAEFIECGCQLAWLIDPVKQRTTVYRAEGSETKVPFEELLTGEKVLPGFEVKLSDLFE